MTWRRVRVPTPFTPENVLKGKDGRWYHDGVDVTDKPVWWKCPACQRSYQASIADRTEHDVGCPDCTRTS